MPAVPKEVALARCCCLTGPPVVCCPVCSDGVKSVVHCLISGLTTGLTADTRTPCGSIINGKEECFDMDDGSIFGANVRSFWVEDWSDTIEVDLLKVSDCVWQYFGPSPLKVGVSNNPECNYSQCPDCPSGYGAVLLDWVRVTATIDGAPPGPDEGKVRWRVTAELLRTPPPGVTVIAGCQIGGGPMTTNLYVFISQTGDYDLCTCLDSLPTTLDDDNDPRTNHHLVTTPNEAPIAGGTAALSWGSDEVCTPTPKKCRWRYLQRWTCADGWGAVELQREAQGHCTNAPGSQSSEWTKIAEDGTGCTFQWINVSDDECKCGEPCATWEFVDGVWTLIDNSDPSPPDPQTEAPDCTGCCLVLWHKYDEASGTTTADSSGNGHTGTLHSTASFVSGVIGNALSGGAGGYVTVPSSPQLDLTTDAEITFWLKRSSSGGITPLQRATSGPANHAWVVVVYGASDPHTPNKLAFSKSGDDQLVSSSNFPVDDYVFVRVNHRASDGRRRIYFNEVLDASGTGYANFASTLEDLQFSVGNDFIDDLRIFSCLLTDEQAAAIYAEGAP